MNGNQRKMGGGKNYSVSDKQCGSNKAEMNNDIEWFS